MQLKSFLLITSVLLTGAAFTAHAAPTQDNSHVYFDCHNLAKRISAIQEKQPFCKNNVQKAVESIQAAATDMFNYGEFIAKSDLKKAIGYLNYTTAEQCDFPADILQAKQDAEVILASIVG